MHEFRNIFTNFRIRMIGSCFYNVNKKEGVSAMPVIIKVLCTAYISEEIKQKFRAALAPAEVTFVMPYGI